VSNDPPYKIRGSGDTRLVYDGANVLVGRIYRTETLTRVGGTLRVSDVCWTAERADGRMVMARSGVTGELVRRRRHALTLWKDPRAWDEPPTGGRLNSPSSPPKG